MQLTTEARSCPKPVDQASSGRIRAGSATASAPLPHAGVTALPPAVLPPLCRRPDRRSGRRDRSGRKPNGYTKPRLGRGRGQGHPKADKRQRLPAKRAVSEADCRLRQKEPGVTGRARRGFLRPRPEFSARNGVREAGGRPQGAPGRPARAAAAPARIGPACFKPAASRTSVYAPAAPRPVPPEADHCRDNRTRKSKVQIPPGGSDLRWLARSLSR